MKENNLGRMLLLDLETTRTGRIRQIGAVFGETVFEKKRQAHSKEMFEALEAMAGDADFVMGHNLLGHDFPILKSAFPQLSLLAKPVIDTLYLSPLAFPRNPYHRLVKDYKLVRSSINDPVADARLAASVFEDQWEQFDTLRHSDPKMLDFFWFCFKESLFNGFSGDGLASVFEALNATDCGSSNAAADYFIAKTNGRVCQTACREFLMPILNDAARRPMLAYCLAWLMVCGSNSVLPPWVRHRFPEISSILKHLRDQSCQSADCVFCRENHDPDLFLNRFFGFASFRKEPSTEADKSLQREIVDRGMQGLPLLAILPTGGGKSLCYQLPALIRHFRRGLLTVVISPLQALMKDQVDNLVKNTGTPFAEAVYGLLTPPERGAALERVRLGDAAVLYIAPEQLRSRSVQQVLKQREIGCWVFDEAHCLSKWGHDFRPDYLYAARFIREFSAENNQAVPSVCGFTATAKLDVIAELTRHFKDELHQDLVLFSGGVERENLDFEVLPVAEAEKYEQTHLIVNEVIASDSAAGVVIYAATRKKTEEIRDFLQHQGMAVQAFHGGLSPKEKRDVIEAFSGGAIPVICATNAFGMGVDKDNIRLVLHFDMPGSLENYIQEAGRAGRDRQPARCVLLYDPESVDLQFGLGALSEVKKRDIQRILRALRRVKRNASGEIVITSDELLRDEELAGIYDKKQDIRDTKVKTAISWLERSGFLQRNQNLTELFQGRPLVKSIAAASEKMALLKLPPQTERLWLNLLRQIFNCPADQGLSADHLAEGLSGETEHLRQIEAASGLTPAQIVISALHEMAEAGLLDRGLVLSAVLRPKGKNNAMKLLQAVIETENQMIAAMNAEDPDAENGNWVELSVARLCQKLKNQGLETSPHVIQNLIKGISYDGRGLAAAVGSFELRHVSRDRYQVRLQRSWDAIRQTVAVRQNTAHTILRELILLSENASIGAEPDGGEVNISFSSNDLAGAIQRDIALCAQVKKVLPAIDRALMFLHEHKIIHLQGGLAVLRQAMTIRLASEAKRRRFGSGDFKPLSVHYRERRFQVHVMAEYAQLGLEKIAGALRLVLDYFSLGRIKFVHKYFSDRKELIEKAVTQEFYRRIVEGLANSVQIGVVGSPVEENALILAGPGSGKTRVIVHRCAYLLQVERISAQQILVLCFNHNAAVTLKKRLNQLIGSRARGVTVVTFHGAAMRIAGISIQDLIEKEKNEEIDFNRIITDAVKLLRGEKEIPGAESDELRDRLLGGYSHILVDEYQDIDQDQYELVAAIAGKSVAEVEGKLSILAVGDDDQNIYAFRGANVQFIKQFKEDYPCRITYLVENYRSTRHIIAAANQLIKNNDDRMKGGEPIRINRDRENFAPGGKWEALDPVAMGRVQVMTVKDSMHQAVSLAAELERLKSIDPDLNPEACAVLGRTKATLGIARSILEVAGYPIRYSLEKTFPVHRVREVAHFIDFLKTQHQNNGRASELIDVHARLALNQGGNAWHALLADFLQEYREETNDARLPLRWIAESLFEFLAEHRREKSIGQGIFLGTIHAAKGMEFEHVFILDGDWNPPKTKQQWEEERRVLYVGMTRARETLLLMRSAAKPNPFLKELDGRSILPRRSHTPLSAENSQCLHQYDLLGLDDVYMDYAGGFGQHCRIHDRLSQLHAGANVHFALKGACVEILDSQKRCIGRLSAKGAEIWKPQMDSIAAIRVIAMLTRSRLDPDEPFQKRIKAAAWELPVLEVIRRQKDQIREKEK